MSKKIAAITAVQATSFEGGGGTVHGFNVFAAMEDGSKYQVFAKSQDRWQAGMQVEVQEKGRTLNGPDGQYMAAKFDKLRADGTPFAPRGGGSAFSGAPAAAPAKAKIDFTEACQIIAEVCAACPDPKIAGFVIPAILSGDVARPTLPTTVASAPVSEAPAPAFGQPAAAPAGGGDGFFDGL